MFRKKKNRDFDFGGDDFFDEDDDKTRAMDDDNFFEEDDFDETGGFDDKTRIDHDDFGDDEGEKTVYASKKRKAEILGFLVVKKGNRKNDRIDITKSDIIIGRSPKCCDIVFDDEDISKIHCRIRKDENGDKFLFFDCGSTNGTLINGEELHTKVLDSHDKITLGDSVEIVFIQV